ncbi:MAG: response regulator [bacterium]|nr:response regulator [bacterium]
MGNCVDEQETGVILLVEDDPADQELTRRALQECPSCGALYVVENGEKALDYLFRRKEYGHPAVSPEPDLIILDLNMPRVDGAEVLRQIRDDGRLCHIPVIVLTTSEREDDISRTYELGANSYITKPMSFDRFADVVQSLERYWFDVVTLPPKREGT